MSSDEDELGEPLDMPEIPDLEENEDDNYDKDR